MKSLALVSILKNEKHNLEQFLSSFKGAVDHVYLCDTGSTDGSIEWIEQNAAGIVGCPVSLTHFEWIRDFSAARNFALKGVKEDYWMWADLDDVLAEKETFIEWKKSAMHLAEMWFAPYWYGWDANGVCQCKFIRERVMKTSKGYQFREVIHEGVQPQPGDALNAVHTWQIHHKRTKEEEIGDRGRNLQILIERYNNLSPRLHAYLGKEFYDAGQFKEAAVELQKVMKYPEGVLDLGDRIMAIQFMALSLFQMKDYARAIEYAIKGTMVDPMRAEFFCVAGDAYYAQGMHHQAIPWYRAATGCFDQGTTGMAKMFTAADMYFDYPITQLAKLYFNIGMYDAAFAEASRVENHDTKDIRARLETMRNPPATEVIECDDIVISCLGEGAYPWDEKIYQEKGIGGSETAAVEMAALLRERTGRQVKVFNHRESSYTAPSGVVYIPNTKLGDYFSKWKPKVHIAWRHSEHLTDATTYVWSHDLATPGVEREHVKNILCLSEFHKSYMHVTQGVTKEKIIVTRNGLKDGRFDFLKEPQTKQYGKVIWPNSPDRGLDYAMIVMDEVRKEIPGAELHVFYGMENMYKYGMKDQADKLKAMMKERPWVKYHGNVDQRTLAHAMASSEVWLYNANFIETFCITALEALACGTYPVARKIGALENTLKEASEMGMADLLDYDTQDVDKYKWATRVIEAIELRKWQDVKYPIEKHSWSSVADEWIKQMEL